MRLAVPVFLLISFAVPASAQLAPPQRRAGYWEMVMSMTTPTPMSLKSHFCTNPAVEQKVSALGQVTPGQDCTTPKINRGPAGFAFESTCRDGARTVRTKGTATGDFQTSYRVVTVSEMSPPMGNQRSNRVQIDSKWLGPCPKGKKPGDMVMPGGQTINIAGMSGGPPPRKR